MKIFFLKSSCNKFWSFKNLSRFLLISLSACLVVAQIVNPSQKSFTQVSSPQVLLPQSAVAVYSSPLDADHRVSVLVDGEKIAKLEDNCTEFFIDGNVTIEIMSESEAPFSVTVLGGDNVEFMGKTKNVRCKKGINYICRAISQQN